MTVEWLDDGGAAGEPRRSRASARGPSTGLGALLAVAALAAAGGFGLGRATGAHSAPAKPTQHPSAATPAPAASIDVTGTVLLGQAYDTVDETDGSQSCTGNNTYSDIAEGATVRILDDRLRLLGITRLETGHPENDGCAFEFVVSVPGGAASYLVDVGDLRERRVPPSVLGEVRMFLD